ncbi:MAG: S-layer homology domain-containing protein [Clostridia bacterium]|nr:S-layer homology domain-containing protein [Clostridia bacterium]
MNKNLKKVISAAAALTLSVSSFAAFAVNFPDVESTASYAQAVQELSALDIISGYEDGTFKPEGLVTRAEITKMIVDARGEGKSAAASAGTSKFSDSVDHWAKGYIAMGVTDGFISGYDDTSFGPDDNVTYVQAQKMLVAALGYDTYAQAQPNPYPGGYKLYANSLGITDGVSANDDDQLTRAQVAQMIDNAMDTPLCVIEKYEPQLFGAPQPVYKTMDGEGKDYQTLFTEKHDAYKVFGRVTKTSKTDNIDADKVSFQVEKADNFDKEYIKSSDPVDIDAYFGDTNAVSLLRTYSEALIQKNEDDEYVIISIVPAAANKSVTVAAEDFDKGVDAAGNTKAALYFYPAGSNRNSTKYSLADGYTVYINGKESSFTFAELVEYIEKNDTAAVTLQKETKIGSTSTDADYNVVMVNSYVTAVVEEVIDKSNETSIRFKAQGAGVGSKMTVYKDDDTYSYSFTMNGEAIEPADLEEDDVLNIACEEGRFSQSNFYDVIVTRNVVENVKCTGIGSSDPIEYTIGGEKYKAATGMSISVEMSTTYSLYLDHFGRIANIDESTVDKKYAILKNIYKKAGGDHYAQIITKEGEEVEYKVDDKNVAAYVGYLPAGSTANDGAAYDPDSAENSKLARYPKQVIEYSVSSSSNKITIKDVLSETPSGSAEYKEASDKIGAVKLSDSTVILDIGDVNTKDEIKTVSKDSLVDGNVYEVVGFDKSKQDSTYRFVLMISGTSSYGPDTQIAIYNSREIVTPEGTDDERTALNLVVNDTEEQIIVDDDCDIPALNEGDPIVYRTNGATEIIEIDPLFEGTQLNGKSYADVYNKVVTNGETLIKDLTDLETALSRTNGDKVTLKFGPVVNGSNGTFTLGKVADFTIGDKTFKGVDYDAADNITFSTGDAKIYTYDFAAGGKNSSKVLLDEGMASTPKVTNATTASPEGHDILDLTDEDVKDEVVFALVRFIDGDEAQEVYLILNSDN